MSTDGIRDIPTGTRRVAAVGADGLFRPSRGVAGFGTDRGCEVVPVNPALAGRRVHGRPVVATLAEAGRRRTNLLKQKTNRATWVRAMQPRGEPT